MRIFIDTANIVEISDYIKLGVIDGVTTNPTLMAKEGNDIREHVLKICQLVNGPVSVEVMAVTKEEMIAEAQRYASMASNIVIKIPVTKDGLEAINILSKYQIKTNATLVFSEAQAILAAQAGATYVSIFVGRLFDNNVDGVAVVDRVTSIFDLHELPTKVIAASIRTPGQASAVALAGAHFATIPPKTLFEMTSHPLTTQGIEKFKADFNAVYGNN